MKLIRTEWHARRKAHLARVSEKADAFVERRSFGVKHPVDDFLFTYYNASPSKLKQWVPGIGVRLEVTADDLEQCPWLREARYIFEDDTVRLNEADLRPQTRGLAAWVAQLCRNVLSRPQRFRCFGLHEWAMVYQRSAEQMRHEVYDLRLSADELARFVESQAICCSHYDAFRFFTPGALGMNVLQPTLETRLEYEQGGCLHTNMDLYKWASKLLPWIGSDLVGECFEHAAVGRQLDMRASPYDLSEIGYEPVRIETAEGREIYELEQRKLAEWATPLRKRLLLACEALT